MVRTRMMVAILGVVLLAGCASSGGKPEASGVPSTQAVMCSKCQVTWVRTPTRAGTHKITRYATHKSLTCPDCEAAVNAYFAADTGKWEHSCKMCGDSLQACEAHRP